MKEEILQSMCDGDVHLWIEQGSSMHIKAITSDGDPVEMSWAQARELAAQLMMLANAGEEKTT
jgi:hypothetical protein